MIQPIQNKIVYVTPDNARYPVPIKKGRRVLYTTEYIRISHFADTIIINM